MTTVTPPEESDNRGAATAVDTTRSFDNDRTTASTRKLLQLTEERRRRRRAKSGTKRARRRGDGGGRRRLTVFGNYSPDCSLCIRYDRVLASPSRSVRRARWRKEFRTADRPNASSLSTLDHMMLVPQAGEEGRAWGGRGRRADGRHLGVVSEEEKKRKKTPAYRSAALRPRCGERLCADASAARCPLYTVATATCCSPEVSLGSRRTGGWPYRTARKLRCGRTRC